jgi:hypothetical protein
LQLLPDITDVFRVDAPSLVTLELRERKEVLYVCEEAVFVREDIVPVREDVVPVREDVVPVREDVGPVREDVVSVSVNTMLSLSFLIELITLCRLPKDAISSSLRSSD